MKRIINFCLNNALFINVLFVGICIAGLVSLYAARREAFPKIDYNFVTVNTIYPGATAEDIEKHITIPIEDQLREIDGIDDLYSTSVEARSVVVVKLDTNLPNMDKTVNDIKNAIDRVDDFPKDALKPIVTELTSTMFPVLNVSLMNKNGIAGDRDEAELRRYAKMLQDRMFEIPGIARIDRQGYRDREMLIEVNAAKLDAYHVSVAEIIMALQKKNVNIPGGLVIQNNQEILVRTLGEVDDIEDLRNVLIRVNEAGVAVRLGQVAVIRDSFEEETVTNKTMGKKSITLTVLKKESSDIIDLVDKVRWEVDNFRKFVPKDYEIVVSNDLSYYVRRRLDVLVSNGIQALVLVAISLVISYGWRISFFTSLAIPFAMFIVFVWMSIQGVTVNLMSMFGLIMALGMLVDNNIVVSDNIYRHIEEKWPLRTAVVKGSVEVLKPIAGTVLTTIASFAPLMFMSGIMGKFMWTLPAVVTVALLASWAECAFVLPVQIHEMQKRRKSTVSLKEEEGGQFFKTLREKYLGALRWCLKHRAVFSAGVTAVFVITLVFAAVAMKFILFPAGGVETVVIKAEAPVGTTLRQMNDRIGRIEQVVAKLPRKELDSYTARAGIIQEQPGDPNAKRGSNYGIVIVYLTPEENRERKADQIIDQIRRQSKDIGGFEKLEFKMISQGPPTGAPVQITIKGDRFDTLVKIAGEYKEFLKTIKGLKDIKDSFEPGKDEYRIYVDEKTATLAGISVFDIATTVRACYAGNVSTAIKKTDEKIDIRVSFPEAERNRLESLRTIKIVNRMGNLIPLEKVARFERTKGISVIYRKDWRRNVNVTAEIDERARDVTSVKVNQLLKEKFKDIANRYPGYTADYEGEFRDTQESVQSLLRSFIIAAVAIFIILVAVFRSLTQPLIIMAVIPLSLVAVIWVFFIHGLPMSFLALMGVVGLAGVVVNNSIVFIDFVNLARSQGKTALEASLEAGAKRLRPILLSSITTVVGLLPTAYGDIIPLGGYDPFLKPMALSMGWGLALGTVITLFITPVMYNIFTEWRVRLLGHDKQFVYGDGSVDYEEEQMDDLRQRVEQCVRQELTAELRREITEEVHRELAEGAAARKQRRKRDGA